MVWDWRYGREMIWKLDLGGGGGDSRVMPVEASIGSGKRRSATRIGMEAFGASLDPTEASIPTPSSKASREGHAVNVDIGRPSGHTPRNRLLPAVY